MSDALSLRRSGIRAGPLRLLGNDRLARLVARGDDAAFEVIYERHVQRLYRYCLAIVGVPEDASDCVQNAMLKAFDALRSSSRDIALGPWLFRVAHNEAISTLRRRRPTSEPDEAALRPAPGADVDAVARERTSRLFEDLRELPERQRGALVLRELNDLSLEEIAAWLGSSVGGARQTLFQARAALNELAEGRDMDHYEEREAIAGGDRRRLTGRKIRAHLRHCAACREAAERAARRDGIGVVGQAGELDARGGPGSRAPAGFDAAPEPDEGVR
jgi:RNA polymerase sigma factor (sigma-70 family)